ncbi:hypothetical protein [Streptomyces sp. NPDC047043]|uniref:hypothetical protein n=1 Tax=Streptomyces sp. NPDC047043 TaxID=3154497 RepID=UPI0033D66076
MNTPLVLPDGSLNIPKHMVGKLAGVLECVVGRDTERWADWSHSRASCRAFLSILGAVKSGSAEMQPSIRGTISTHEAAAILGRTPRRARQLGAAIGGFQPEGHGHWRFDERAVRAYVIEREGA